MSLLKLALSLCPGRDDRWREWKCRKRKQLSRAEAKEAKNALGTFYIISDFPIFD
jgi:hypothetical protein